jgi:hypothetical protein
MTWLLTKKVELVRIARTRNVNKLIEAVTTPAPLGFAFLDGIRNFPF